MKQILVMMAAVVLVGCGEYREAMDKKIAKAKASKTPQQTKAKSDKLITDPIVEKEVRRRLKKSTGELTKADLIKVTFVVFEFTKITDADLKEVAKLQNLEKLSLPKQITDEGLKELAQLQKLKSLSLANTQVTEAGLKEVAKLEQLEQLHLTLCNQISDAGLKELAKLKKLKFLSLANTQVTEAGVAELRKALPNCNIFGP